MRVTVIGCSGSFPGPDSPASCYLVEHDASAVLLDLGSGALGPLQQHVDLDRIDAVLLSHLHADHCLDLTGYYVYRRYHPRGPRPAIPVLGPVGTSDRMARAYDLDVDPGMTTEFDFRTYSDSVQIGPFEVSVARVRHPVEAYGIRVAAGGRTVVYSGDTGPTQSLRELAREADLALFEASLLDGDEQPDLHMTARQAGGEAAAAGVRHLVLTHLVPWNDARLTLAQAQETFTGPVELARSGAVFDLA